jgi:hypothetical protein
VSGLHAEILEDDGQRACVSVTASEEITENVEGEVVLTMSEKSLPDVRMPIVVSLNRWCTVFPERLAGTITPNAEGIPTLAAQCSFYVTTGDKVSVSVRPSCFTPIVNHDEETGMSIIRLHYSPSSTDEELQSMLKGEIEIRAEGKDKVVRVPVTAFLLGPNDDGESAANG